MTLWLNTTINSSALSELFHLIKQLQIFNKLFRVLSMGVGSCFEPRVQIR